MYPNILYLITIRSRNSHMVPTFALTREIVDYRALTPVSIINGDNIESPELWPINTDWRSVDHTFTISNLPRMYVRLFGVSPLTSPGIICIPRPFYVGINPWWKNVRVARTVRSVSCSLRTLFQRVAADGIVQSLGVVNLESTFAVGESFRFIDVHRLEVHYQ